MILWMTYTLLVGGLLMVASLALEHCARNLRLAQRWLWIAALAGTIGLAATSPLRTKAVRTSALTVDVSAARAVRDLDSGTTGLRAVLADIGAKIGSAFDAPVNAVAARASGPAARQAGVLLGGIWICASVALLSVFMLTLLRYRAARRRWAQRELAGVRVRVAEDVGPAVIGVMRPEVVVPSWLLQASDDEQSMVIAHEHAHLLSRDHLLLAFGCIALVLLPWHPLVWWMTRRLRLAVEMDCDARVLRSGAQPGQYGLLLVAMAAHRTALPFGAAALAASSTPLERRLIAMTNPAPRRRLARNSVSACLAGGLLFAACQADLPTGAELDEMDVAAIEEATARIPLTAAEPLYIIDGVASDAAAARALEPEAIATVNVMKGSGATMRPIIDIVTRAAAERAIVTRAAAERAEGDRVDDVNPEDRAAVMRPLMKSDASTARATLDGEFDGILMIDGRRAHPSVLNSLSPESIERVNVLKGAAAARLFADPAAQNGVIQIYTKAGSDRR